MLKRKIINELTKWKEELTNKARITRIILLSQIFI